MTDSEKPTELKNVVVKFECQNCGHEHEAKPWLYPEVQEALATERRKAERLVEAVKDALPLIIAADLDDYYKRKYNRVVHALSAWEGK